MGDKASIRDSLAAGLVAQGIAVTTDAAIHPDGFPGEDAPHAPSAQSLTDRVFDEVERIIPGAIRTARGLEMDGDAVAEAVRRIDAEGIDENTGEITEQDDGGRRPHPDATFRVPARRDFVDPLYIQEGGNPDSDYAPLVDFLPAPEVAEVARRVMAKYRRRFPHLFAPFKQRIEFLWKRTGGESAGRETLGMCVKVGTLAKHFAHRLDPRTVWVIWVAADNCALITNHQMEALCFHELLHTGMNEKRKPQIQGHDVEEFRAVIEEYGFWKDDLLRFKASVMQRSLFEADNDAEGE